MIVENEILNSKFHLNYSKSIKILPLFWKRGWHLLKLLLPIINLMLRYQGRPDSGLVKQPCRSAAKCFSPEVVLRTRRLPRDMIVSSIWAAQMPVISKNIAELPQIWWYKVVILMISGYWSCSSLGWSNIKSKSHFEFCTSIWGPQGLRIWIG